MMILKTMAGLGVFAVGISAFAAGPTLELTSFRYVDSNSRVAELCGVVRGTDKPSTVKAVSDPTTSAPGTYNIVVGADGHFCAVLASYTGRVSASLWGVSQESKPVEASISR